MVNKFRLVLLLLLAHIAFINGQVNLAKIPFSWDNATVYFMLTDRFNNGDPNNDGAYGRQKNSRNHEMDFQGGDLKGLTAKINEGYFDRLGINAIWITAFYEQYHNPVGEHTHYGYHGYFTKDWSQMDDAMGTEDDLREMIDAAHSHGIRIILDVVMNHSGYPVDGNDKWFSEWAREFYEGGDKTLYEPLSGLPDMRTEDPKTVNLPQWLINKWQSEGVKDKEIAELDAFFTRTGKTRNVKNYLIKWLSDWVREYGIDGFRCDTAKHITVDGWKDLKDECVKALKEWKSKNPTKKLDDLDFWMTGEVYGQNVWTGKNYYYDNGFDNIINFSYVGDVNNNYEDLFTNYSDKINKVAGYNVLSYIASHDVGPSGIRSDAWRAAVKMMLTPGGIQIYYGDESKRPFFGAQTYTDQGYRSFMNWNDISNNQDVKNTLEHWGKFGNFRREHSAVGGGLHSKKSDSPYTFTRSGGKAINNDAVVVALDIQGTHSSVTISAYGLWPDGTVIKDYYSGNTATVTGGNLTFQTSAAYVLAGKPAVPAENVVLTASQPAGWYNPSVTVNLSATTTASGATTAIYYTLDGSTPTASSTLYNAALTFTASKTLKAVAIDSKGNQSNLLSNTYNIGIEPPSLTVLPISNSFENGSNVSVTMVAADTKDSNPKIYYTTNGTTPTTASTLYSGSFTVTGTNEVKSVKAIATNAQGGISEVKETKLTFTTLPKGLTVYFKKPSDWSGVNLHYWNCTPSSVTPTTWPGVAMSDVGNGYYKYVIVGATQASMVFNNAGNSNNKTTDQVNVTLNPGYYNNGVWSSSPETDATVTLTPDAGTYNPSVAVSMTATGTATPLIIRYTTDGSTPSATVGNIYAGALNLTSNCTVKAVAIDALGGVSPVITKSYIVGTQPNLRVHIRVTGQTSAPYLYAWTPEHNGAWPGKQITGSADDDGYFTYIFPDGVTSSNIIFNLGQGKNQTADIMNVTSETYYTWDGNNKSTPTADVHTALTNIKESKTISAPYPNPFTNQISVNLTESQEEVTVSIYSASGDEVFSNQFSNVCNLLTFDLNLPIGLYIMRLSTQKETISYKIIRK